MSAPGWEVDWTPIAGLSADDRAEARALSAVVYPPNVADSWPGRHLEWSPPQWCARVRSADGKLVGFVGAQLREARCDGRRVRVGGIGGVMTHPDHRRRGVARTGIDCAVGFFRDAQAPTVIPAMRLSTTRTPAASLTIA